MDIANNPDPSQRPFIEFKDVCKAFAEIKVCDHYNLQVQKGETLCIMGPSGVGKTVGLKMLIGLLTPDSGEITFDGIRYSEIKKEEDFLTIRQRISMVFQGAALFDSLNVYDNIAYPLKLLQKYTPEEIKHLIHEKLDWVGLPDAASKMPSELSGGMKKRVGLARAIATSPEVIMYDEPSAGLDPINTARITDVIADLNERLQCTSLVVTHDIPFAEKLSQRVAFVYSGKIVALGSISELLAGDNALVKGFLTGNPKLVDDYLAKGIT